MSGYLKVALLALMGATSVAAIGQDDTYKTKCQMCHGATGLADTPAGKAMQAQPFNSPAFVKASDASLIAIVKSGKGKMPAFAGKLTDAQITAVVAYTRTLSKN